MREARRFRSCGIPFGENDWVAQDDPLLLGELQLQAVVQFGYADGSRSHM
jgi:hypothetical protein